MVRCPRAKRPQGIIQAEDDPEANLPPEAEQQIRDLRLLAGCRVCRSTHTSSLCGRQSLYGSLVSIRHFLCMDWYCVLMETDADAKELFKAYGLLNIAWCFAETERENRQNLLTAIAHLALIVPKAAPVLDIGAVNGMPVRLLREAGYRHVSWHEIGTSDLSPIETKADALYHDFDYHKVPEGSIDAATLLDVLEHFRGSSFLLATCGRILRRDGVLNNHSPIVTRMDRFVDFI